MGLPTRSRSREKTSRPSGKPRGDRQHEGAQSPPGQDLQPLIAKRAYELYAEHGYRHGCALEDWLEAEREIVSRAAPV